MKPLSHEELNSRLVAAIDADDAQLLAASIRDIAGMTNDAPYPGWLKAVIWLGLTAFSWGLVIGVIYTVYLWLYL